MSANAENIKTLINSYVRNYAVSAFQSMRLNRILLLLTDLADAAGGGVGNGAVVVRVTSSDFSNATDCPLTTLAGQNIAIFYNENQRFIEKDAVGGPEWSDLAGGGFRVLIPGFDKSAANFHFYVYVL